MDLAGSWTNFDPTLNLAGVVHDEINCNRPTHRFPGLNIESTVVLRALDLTVPHGAVAQVEICGGAEAVSGPDPSVGESVHSKCRFVVIKPDDILRGKIRGRGHGDPTVI